MFDGKNWKSYTTENSGLSGDIIGIITVDKKGQVWIVSSNFVMGEGPVGSGINVFDGKNWENYTSENSGLANNKINSIAFDNFGRAWIGTDYGLNIFDGQTWITYTSENSGLESDFVNSIAFDESGRAWIGGSSGISIFDSENWISFSNDYTDFIVFDNLGRAWVGSTIIRVYENDKVVATYSTEGRNLMGYPVITIAFDQFNRAWIGTSVGVCVFDGKTWLYPSILNRSK